MLQLPDLILSLGAAALTVVIALWWTGQNRRRPQPASPVEQEPLTLLFEDGILNHATNRAAALLAMQPGCHVWDDLRDVLANRFPDFPLHAGAGERGTMTLRARDSDGPDEASISWRGALCWVMLRQQVEGAATQLEEAIRKELSHLRLHSDTAPNPVWQENAQGQVIWHNEAYGSLYRLFRGHSINPDTPLFDLPDGPAPERVSIATIPGTAPDSYELKAITVDGVTSYHATCINAVVAAEDTQRNFVQTLAKTFAHLSIGLAIFDRKGQLALFNPALVDLTGLPARILSGQPTVMSFFDQLRENRRMPEPKSYRSWRQEIADLIAAASDGCYQETWTLESSQTYCVTGRPHPDGAIAFLIEDKSSEMTVTRKFRAELEQAQLLIDAVDEAMAVFAANGVLTCCNAAYRKLWKVDPEAAFADITVHDSIGVWRSAARSDADFSEVERYVAGAGSRDCRSIRLVMRDGKPLRCEMTPVSAGSSLIRFHARPVATPTVPNMEER